MSHIDYREIFEESWKITTKKRFLWIFAFFIVGSAFWMDIPFQFLPHSLLFKNKSDLANIPDVTMLWIVLVIALIYLLRIISFAGLIKSLGNLRLYSRYTYRQIFGIAKKYLLALVYLELLTVLYVITVIIVIFIPISHINNAGYDDLEITIIGAFVAIVMLILGFFVRKYAWYYLILANENIISSLKKGWNSFKKNFFKSIMFALVIGLLIFAAQLVILSLVTFSAMTTSLIAGKFHAIFFIAGKDISAIFSIGIPLLIMIFLLSILEVFAQTAWLQFFNGIASAKSEKEEFAAIHIEMPKAETI